MSIVRKKRRIRALIILLSILLSIVLASIIYLSDYYRAKEDCIDAFAPMNGVSSRTLEDGMIVFEPENATAGLIFYPGER